MQRGLDRALAEQVATQLTAHDRLQAHLRDELGLDPEALSSPLQAAATSAISFALFGLVPIAALLAAPASLRIPAIAGASLLSLAALGALGGHLGGAPRVPAALRVVVGGAIAMSVTAGIGHALAFFVHAP